ncbi:metallophosphoesterase [Cohnella zeiphila]|uniref:Serine/threonine protein phosphatase n=1 Tax=Cohnella zeiphila TaxID=2761120 RepID=A0A7X0VXW7_9BACL|nr:metallophosphoesterase [Cohnella zeiphila]MBB6734065.1 serine/threonine protein phosphatase [Cohnella zeiphila]
MDQLIFGGDYINRGKDSGKVIKTVKQLKDKHPDHVVALIGNHEEMMKDYYRNGDQLWLKHGGQKTLKDFEKTFAAAEMEELVEWVCKLPLVYEDDQFIFTHSGLNPYEALNEQSRDILWMSEADFYDISKEVLFSLTRNKPVVHGHTPVERIYFDGARLNGDLGSHTYFLEEERGLALVDLSRMIYYVYKQSTGKIEKREVLRF